MGSGCRQTVELQQLERALDFGQPFGADVEINGGGRQTRVTQQTLDDGQFDARFQQMSCKAVPKTMDSAAGGELGARDGAIENTLSGAVGQGLTGILRRREEPVTRTATEPVTTQFVEQARGQQGVTILFAFALHHANLVPFSVEVFGLEMAGFVETQTAAVDGHEENSITHMRAAVVEEPFNFLAAVNLRPANLAFHPGQGLPEDLRRTLEHPLVKGAQGTDGLVDATGGELAPLHQVEEEVLELIVGELLRRSTVVLGQLIHPRHVSFLGAL